LNTGGGTGFEHEVAMRLARKGFDVIAAGEICAQVQTLKREAANGSVIGALSILQLARSQALLGDGKAARKPYEDFLTFGKEADPDLPLYLYKTAQAEYAVLRKTAVQ
jgi:hypothetical protein